MLSKKKKYMKELHVHISGMVCIQQNVSSFM